MPPLFLYSLARLAVFAAVAVVLFLLGFHSFLLVALALVISLPLSAVLLRGLRARLTADLTRRMDERRANQERLRSALRDDDED